MVLPSVAVNAHGQRCHFVGDLEVAEVFCVAAEAAGGSGHGQGGLVLLEVEGTPGAPTHLTSRKRMQAASLANAIGVQDASFPTGCNDVGSLPEPIQFLDRHRHPCGAQRRAVGSERGRRFACRTTLPVHRRARWLGPWQLPPAGRGSRTNVCTRRKRTYGPQGGSPGLDPGCVKTPTQVTT